MANLRCLLFGHKKTLAPLSSNRWYCRRCGLDLDGSEGTPQVPAQAPMIPKRGAARRLHR